MGRSGWGLSGRGCVLVGGSGLKFTDVGVIVVVGIGECGRAISGPVRKVIL